LSDNMQGYTQRWPHQENLTSMSRAIAKACRQGM
jgi:hypothetical protein